MSDEHGGPAFAYGNNEQGGHSGMSLRDYFAGQALQHFARYRYTGATETDWEPDEIAEICYELAKAMIEFREDN